MTEPRRITLLTDFGARDSYVGELKGVIASRAPAAMIDDVAHELPPGDLQAAAWTLRGYWRTYPEHTVHVVVVDPGVGGERRAIAARLDGRFIVAPDNGVITLALAAAVSTDIVEIRNPEILPAVRSATFHGRDLFVPAAAALATGAALEALGPRLDDPVTIVWPQPSRAGRRVDGEAVHVDGFGSLISNIPADWCPAGGIVRVDDRLIGPIRTTYADALVGDLVAVIGSAETLEVAVRDGSAARELDAARGARIRVEPAEVRADE
ncbi:MAG: SAM hydrolase/SAM-dependent halogenase family protein [Longimicrobiales bacterium]